MPDSAPSTNDTRVLAQRAREAIDSLRHRKALQDDHIERWITTMLERDPGRMSWHIRRLDGVNASSVYSYVADLRQTYDSMDPARLLDLQRQLIAAPAETNTHMLRGTMMEAVAAHIAHEHYRVRTQERAMAAITAQCGIPQAPSLRGNPDETVSYDGRLAIWDYKVPAVPKHPSDAPMGEYIAQLHQYALLARAARQPVGAMALIHLEMPEELANDMANDLAGLDQERRARRAEGYAETLLRLMHLRCGHGGAIRLRRQPIAFDKAMAQDIIRAANAADERAMRGELLPYPRRPDPDISDAARERGMGYQTKAARLIALRKELEEEESEVQKGFKSLLKGVDTRGKAQPFPLLSVNTRFQIDTDRAARHLEALQVPAKEYTNPGGFDPKRVTALASRIGVDPDTLREPPIPDVKKLKQAVSLHDPDALPELGRLDHSVSLTRAKKGAPAEQVERLQTQMRAQLTQITHSAESIDAGEIPSESDAAPDDEPVF